MTRADFLRPGADVLTADDLDVDGKKVVLWDPDKQQMSAGGAPVSGAGVSLATGVGNAAANTATLQNLIYLTGTVSITTPGLYYLNATIFLRSNVRLTVGAGVELRQAPGINKPMFVTEAYTPVFATNATAVPAANLTSVGLVATLAQTGIGTAFPVGSFFALLGADQYAYDGVFRVETATADSITYKLSRAAAASPATGTIYIKAATSNVRIDGDGTINYNQPENNGAATLYDASCVIFEHANKCSVGGSLKFGPAKKYGVWWSNVRDCISDGQYFQTPSDGNHLCGPVRGYMRIQNLSGYCGDDIVGLSNGDNPTGELTRGEGDDVYIGNITGESTLLAIVSIVGGGDYAMKWHNITLEDVKGSTSAGAINLYEYVTGGATLHSTSIGKLTLRGINATEFADGGMVNIGGSTNGVKIDQLILEGLRPRKVLTGQQSPVFIYQKAQIGRVTVRDLYSEHGAGTTGSGIKVLDTAAIGTLEVASFNFLPGGSGNVLIGKATTATIGKTIITAGDLNGAAGGKLGAYGMGATETLEIFIGGGVTTTSPNDHFTISGAAGGTVNMQVAGWKHNGGNVTPVYAVTGINLNVRGFMDSSYRFVPQAGCNLRLNGATLKAAGSLVTAPQPGDQFFDTDGSASGTAGIGVKARTNAGAWNLLY